ncbi:MFS transporter [Actinokineospora sp. NPDC004072]
MNRALVFLIASQVVGSLGLAAGAASGPLLAELITGSAASGSVAMSALVAGSALAGPLAAALMRRGGRMRGILACHAAAAIGAAIAVFSVDWGFAALLVGSVLLGAGTTGVMLGRYVAADLAEPGRAARAIGAAVAAVTIGAVVGPLLLGPLGPVAQALGFVPETALHLLAVVAFPAAAVIGLGLLARTKPVGEPAPARGRVPGRARPLAVLGLGNLSMVALMGAAPNHLQHNGAGLDLVGVVMAVHIGAMFAFGPLSAALAARLGPQKLALAAMVGMSALMLLGLASGNLVVDLALLILVALFWNAHLISGSMWLIEVTPEELRPRAEGFGEFAMGAAGALGSLVIAGAMVAIGGLVALCLALAVLNAVAAAVLFAGRRGAAGADLPVSAGNQEPEVTWEPTSR